MGDLLGNGASLGEASPWGWVLRLNYLTPFSVPSLLPKGGHIETSRPRLPSVPFQPRQAVLLTLRVKISPFLPELLHVRYSVITRKTQCSLEITGPKSFSVICVCWLCRLCELKKSPLFTYVHICDMHMYAHGYLYVWGPCMHAGACTLVHLYMWRPKVDVRCLPKILCTLVYTGTGFHLNPELSDPVGPACSRIPCLCLLSSGIVSGLPHPPTTYTGSRDPNPGLHNCKASEWHTKPSPSLSDPSLPKGEDTGPHDVAAGSRTAWTFRPCWAPGFPLMSIALVNCSHDYDQTPDKKLTFKGDTVHCGSRNVRLLITLHSQWENREIHVGPPAPTSFSSGHQPTGRCHPHSAWASSSLKST